MARKRTGARALHLLVDILIDNIIIGAASSTHGNSAKPEGHSIPENMLDGGQHAGLGGGYRKGQRPKAGPEQKPPTNGTFKTRQARIGTKPRGQQRIRPVATHSICNAPLTQCRLILHTYVLDR